MNFLALCRWSEDLDSLSLLEYWEGFWYWNSSKEGLYLPAAVLKCRGSNLLSSLSVPGMPLLVACLNFSLSSLPFANLAMVTWNPLMFCVSYE